MTHFAVDSGEAASSKQQVVVLFLIVLVVAADFHGERGGAAELPRKIAESRSSTSALP